MTDREAMQMALEIIGTHHGSFKHETTTLREVMQMALEIIETHHGEFDYAKEIAAIRESLEQPKGLFIGMIAAQGPEFVEEVRRVGENIEQKADPVAWVFAPNNELLWPSEVEVTNPIEIDSYQPLYTTPPQRKPLTIHEVEQILAQHNYEIHGDRARYIVRMTEEAHGIKETP